jgi:hypothetical protein
MTRRALVLGVAAASILALAGERTAKACGGCFHPPTQNVSDITDERMLLSVSPRQTTLYDQIRYDGSPTSFAWVLPIHGTVDVGLSADVLFDTLDVLTETQIVPPEQNCPGPPAACVQNGGGTLAATSAGGAGAAGGVTVTKAQNVGPYETVQLHATDSSALESWLAQNGFQIPADVKPVVAEYVTEGFDFLAMKLLPNAGVQSMRPVRVTTQGASLSLPLRMAAIGTGVSVGITIWVVSDGRYEPQNFPFFHIEDSELVWDWSTSLSNYTTLRVQKEGALGGKGWEIESSISLNEQLITNVILSGGQYYPGGGFGEAPGGGVDAGDDYLGTAGPDGGDGGMSPGEVRDADIAALFAGMTGPNVRVTRMRSDIAHSAMTTDFVLQASADQSELSNVRNVTNQVNLRCPVYDNCQVVGTAPPDQAAELTLANANNGGKSSFNCETSAVTGRDLGTRLASGAGLLGLVGAWIARSRRRAAK